MHVNGRNLSMSSTLSTDHEIAAISATKARRIPFDGWVLAGIAIALAATLFGIASTGVSLRYFLQPTAAWIVIGGTLGVTLVTTPRRSLLNTIQSVAGLVRERPVNRKELAEEIVSCVRIARVQGILAIESHIERSSHPFLSEMLTLVVDLKGRNEFKETLEARLRLRERQGDADAKVLEVAGGFAPAIGVIGTVLGLIDVLRAFSNINSVALGIGTAFVSTMYGLVLANLILLPAAHRIRACVAEIFEVEEMIVEGGLCLIDGIHPSLVRERLSCFLRKE